MQSAWFELSETVEQSGLAPSKKSTLPTPLGLVLPVTVARNVSESPSVLAFVPEKRATVVVVEMFGEAMVYDLQFVLRTTLFSPLPATSVAWLTM